MGELQADTTQSINSTSVAVSSVPGSVSPTSLDAVSGNHPVELMSPHHHHTLSPVQGLPASRSQVSDGTSAIQVSVANMIDSGDFRSQMPEPTYQTLNGRMSPSYNPSQNSYATLTPLQPLPPISTVSDKFSHVGPNVSGSFTLMQNNGLGVSSPLMDMNTYRYDKMSMGGMGVGMNMSSPLSSSPMPMMSSNGYSQQSLSSYGYNMGQNGLHSPNLKPEHKMMSCNAYDPYPRTGLAPTTHSTRLHSPNPMVQTTLNGLHNSPLAHSPTSTMSRDRTSSSSMESGGSKHELEEINTKELAQKISSELKRYSIPQAVFAQRVLCRSQGTLSDLLRNPKPWSKLKSGRETFRRMWKWLQEPEFQRMSALRLAGKKLFELFTLNFFSLLHPFFP